MVWALTRLSLSIGVMGEGSAANQDDRASHETAQSDQQSGGDAIEETLDGHFCVVHGNCFRLGA